jgi:hypothetical protein
VKAIASSRTVFAAGVLALSAACGVGDSRVQEVEPGITRDSAIALLTQSGGAGAVTSEPGTDSLRNIWRKTMFLRDGKNIEIIYYSPTGEQWAANDTVPQDRVIPVVLIDGKVFGVGRPALDRVNNQYGLPKNNY